MHVIHVTTFGSTSADNTEQHEHKINDELAGISGDLRAMITLHHTVTLIENHSGEGSVWLYSTIIQVTY